MITAQDIREKAFKEARLNGYTMSEVDEFLDEIADEIAALQKENSTLKAKMKILADKVQEYRAGEETLSSAILSAQKCATQIESDARTRANAILDDANKQAAARIGSISTQADAEEKRLADAKTASAKFLSDIRGQFGAQLSNIESIINGIGPVAVEEEAPAAAASVDETVRNIEDSVSRIEPAPSFKFDLSSAMDAPTVGADDLGSTQQFSF